MSWLGDAIQAALNDRQRQIDAEILAVQLNPPPSRIVRSQLCARNQCWEIPGTQFADGLPRLIVSPHQFLGAALLEEYGE